MNPALAIHTDKIYSCAARLVSVVVVLLVVVVAKGFTPQRVG